MAASQLEGQLHIVGAGEQPPARVAVGRAILTVASLILAATLVVQVLDRSGAIALGIATWRPLLYAFVLWAIAVCVAQALIRGEMGLRALFVLPAVLFTVAMVSPNSIGKITMATVNRTAGSTNSARRPISPRIIAWATQSAMAQSTKA